MLLLSEYKYLTLKFWATTAPIILAWGGVFGPPPPSAVLHTYIENLFLLVQGGGFLVGGMTLYLREEKKTYFFLVGA